jgi:hypothetical protein
VAELASTFLLVVEAVADNVKGAKDLFVVRVRGANKVVACRIGGAKEVAADRVK